MEIMGTNEFGHLILKYNDNIRYWNVLCIELDNIKYHDYSKRRTEMDMIKTKELLNNNVNFIRIRTNESGGYYE